MSDDTPVNQGEIFIALATALPEMLNDIDNVFDAQTESGQWNEDSIAQATTRLRTLAKDDVVVHSVAATRLLEASAENFDALNGLDGSDADQIQTLREMFTTTPALLLNCNNVAADMEAVSALVTHLQDSAWPQPLSDNDAEVISIDLLSSQSPVEIQTATTAIASSETYPDVDSVDLKVEFESDINPVLREAFMNEIPGRVREFSECIGQLVAGTGDDETIFSAQRAAHTIKGSANVSGVTGMGWLTHLSEDIVEFIAESSSASVPSDTYELLQDASDCLECQVEHLKEIGPYPDDTAIIYSKLRDTYLALTSESEADNVDKAVLPVAQNDVSIDEETAAAKLSDVIETKTTESGLDDTVPESKPTEVIDHVPMAVAESNQQEQLGVDRREDDAASSDAQMNAASGEGSGAESEEELLGDQDRAFISLAIALPEMLGDADTVFNTRIEENQWNGQSIDQATTRLRSLAGDSVIEKSRAATTVLTDLADNYDALNSIEYIDEEQLLTLQTLFTTTPALLLNCNNVAADMEAVGALVTHLQDSSWPEPLSDEDAEVISIELLSGQQEEDSTLSGLDSAATEIYPPPGEVDLKVELAADINPMLREAFMNEIPDRVREFSECVGQLMAGIGDDEVLFTAQRAAHTIKGSAHVSGVSGMGWLTHLSEDIVEFITESRPAEVPADAYELLQEASDCLECQVEHLKGLSPYPEETSVVYTKLRDMYLTMSGADLTATDAETPESIDAHKSEPTENNADQRATDLPEPDKLASEVAAPVAVTQTRAESDDAANDKHVSTQGYESSDNQASESRSVTVAAMPEYRPSKARLRKQKQSDELAEKSIHLSIRQLKSLQNLAGDFSIHNVRMDGFRGDTAVALGDLARQQAIVQQRLEDLNTLLMYQGVQSTVVQLNQEGDDFDALEMDQYTELHSATNLAYEAVTDSLEMTNNLQRDVKVFGEILADNSRVSRDFNDEISSIRMVTSAELTPRLQRVARQTAKATGKTVELVIEGEDVQFDRDLYNPLAEALLHAIRNAIDHGIEAPAERLANDKPETGTVTIRLERESGEILITCHDDGAGLDFEAIRKKAISNGLLNVDDSPTQNELANMVFAPGFSTRKDVSQISGRGMGMNIVFEAIRTRHGSVDIESEAAVGTTIRMRMPMSLTSMHLIVARFGNETYAIPSNSVEQLVLSDMGELVSLDTPDGGKEQIFRMADQDWKIFALGTLLGTDEESGSANLTTDSIPLVLLKTAQGNYAVRLHHASHSGLMVVKSFGDYIQRINGILGGAILSDGSMCPVLDLAELADFRRDALKAYRSKDIDDVGTAQDKEFVLVVDDSLSARRALVQLLIDAGFETREARDGIDAIELMDKATPKVVITDLEMPRMNGVELVQHIRSRDSENTLPIVMITSRSTQKHKSRAMDAGVNHYVNKPWDEDKLVELISQYYANQLADVA